MFFLFYLSPAISLPLEGYSLAIVVFLVGAFKPESSGGLFLGGQLCESQGSTTDLWSLAILGLLGISWVACLVGVYSMHTNAWTPLTALLTIMTYICHSFFSTQSWLWLYVWFELSLIPIFLIILGWGYQAERLLAAKAMFFYTIAGSMPLLLLLLSFNGLGTPHVYQLCGSAMSGPLTAGLMVALAAFLVKLPMFFTHMWLPKAHVEAPVVGSMYLAAILLKLGGYGVLKMGSLACHPSWSAKMFVVVSLWGLAVIPLACVYTTDMKVLIALSSVAHMSVAVVLSLSGGLSLVSWAALILLTHGLSSAMAFFQSFLVYKVSHTRSLLLNKKMKGSSGLFSLLWGVMALSVMGGPPSVNLWVEVGAFLVGVSVMAVSTKFFFWAAILTGVYSLVLISYPYTGNKSSGSGSSKFEGVNLVLLVFYASLSVVSVGVLLYLL